MTEEELAAIEARAKAATDVSGFMVTEGVYQGNGCYGVLHDGACSYNEAAFLRTEDLAFYAKARQDVLDLCEALRRAQDLQYAFIR